MNTNFGTVGGGPNSQIAADSHHEIREGQRMADFVKVEQRFSMAMHAQDVHVAQVPTNEQNYLHAHNHKQHRNHEGQNVVMHSHSTEGVVPVQIASREQQPPQQQRQLQRKRTGYDTPTYLHMQPDFVPTFTDLLPPPPPNPDDADATERDEARRRRCAASQHVYNPSYALSLLSVSEFSITAIPHPFDITEPVDLQPPLEGEFRLVLEDICRNYCGASTGSEDDTTNSAMKAKRKRNVPVFEEGKWRIPLSAYRSFHTYLTSKKGLARVEGIPEDQLKVAMLGRQRMDRSYPKAEELIGKGVPAGLASALAPYQRGGVDFCLERNGRALLGDDMGLGKSVQAIATMSCFEKDWPLLVLCPSSARYHWEAEFRQWLGRKSNINQSNDIEKGPLKKRRRIDPTDGTDNNATSSPSSMKLLRDSEVYVLNSSSDDAFLKPDFKARVVICSYGLVLNLVAKNKLTPGRFMAAIVDESHMLKDKTSKRTKALVPILKETKYCLMLSGTPALARPRDLWPQLNILGCSKHGDGSWWQDEDSFLSDYVKGKNKRGKDKNFAQLHALLTSTVMIRRTKADMLKDLPPKKRGQIRVTISDDKVVNEFNEWMKVLRGGSGALAKIARAQHATSTEADPMTDASSSADDMTSDNSIGDPRKARRQVLNQLYSLTGKSKVPAVASALKQWLADPTKGKVCIFAHHISVLNDIVSGAGLSNAEGSTTKYIRIDGSTLPKARQDGIMTFQNDPTTRVAILGITAASVAITLTAASTVWFAELFWTPAIMLQAEDRCHRIGQQNVVRCSYFFAKGSLDELLWKLVEQKYRDLGEFVEGKENLQITIHDIDDKENGEEKKCDDTGCTPVPAAGLDEELQRDIIALGMEEEAMLKEGSDDSDDGGDGYNAFAGGDVSPARPLFDCSMPLPHMLLYKMDFAGAFGFVISPFQGRMVVRSKSSRRVQALGANVKPDVGDILVMVNGIYLPRNVEYKEMLMMLKSALQNPPGELVFVETGTDFRNLFCRMEGLSPSPLLDNSLTQICPTTGVSYPLSQVRNYTMHFNTNYGIVVAPVQGRMVVRSRTPRRIQEFGEHSKPNIGDVLVAVNGKPLAPGMEYTRVLMMLKYAMMQPPAALTFEEDLSVEAAPFQQCRRGSAGCSGDTGPTETPTHLAAAIVSRN